MSASDEVTFLAGTNYYNTGLLSHWIFHFHFLTTFSFIFQDSKIDILDSASAVKKKLNKVGRIVINFLCVLLFEPIVM